MTDPLLIIGATSGIGACAVEDAVGRGLSVRAFARSAGTLDATDLVEPFAGDARSPDDVSAALSGVRAVICALGIKERLAMLWEEETVFSDCTRVLIEAMKAREIKRLIVVTGFGASRSRKAMSSLERLGHRAVLGKPYADKDRQEAMIMDSDLDWTIARPVILTRGPKSDGFKVLRDPSTWRNGLVSRRDVARYLVDAVEDKTDIRADVVLTR
jgi:putative NADH-flavin reductase